MGKLETHNFLAPGWVQRGLSILTACPECSPSNQFLSDTKGSPGAGGGLGRQGGLPRDPGSSLSQVSLVTREPDLSTSSFLNVEEIGQSYLGKETAEFFRTHSFSRIAADERTSAAGRLWAGRESGGGLSPAGRGLLLLRSSTV